ncbi:bifunctional phosphatase PAP2/O-acyltransferase family protein [Nocardia mexicana]|uniref:Wax ester synthase-like acyl-CoA acyltransferase family protein n=1 Tax=Nocardia mexicana TaxID=279262 RepID=A0A370HDW9_9NOCA|nr:phosphatase PAP2 family protein [Nocardia mexicana]RDI53073.1 wax ester synthase-like acyl-CoA acyltransferase family protein [Nocardia mexicana]
MGTPSRPALGRDIAVGLAVFGLYLLVDTLHSPERRVAADRNARGLFELERWLHADVELSLNRWLAGREWLATLANYEYAFTYILTAFVLLFWMYFRRPADYPRARDSFLLLNVLAIACFAVYPVTPPRLLPDLGFVDTVVAGGTWGSWGTPLVDGSNQLAAVPSLHVGWALWVSVVLARIAGGVTVQVLSALHVLVTVYVIMATANHFILDAVVAVGFVVISVLLVDRWYARPPVVGPADAFFLHVENAGVPQQVGGMVVLHPRPDGGPTADEVRALVRAELAHLPRFRQRLHRAGRWRRARWVGADIDWAWHVTERTLETPSAPAYSGGRGDSSTTGAGIAGLVGELAAEPLPRDRPLWRLVLVRDPAAGVVGVLLLLHHTVADGTGTVIQALRLLRPSVDLFGGESGGQAAASREKRGGRRRRGPGRAARMAATATGFAQLATDARPAGRLPGGSTRRTFAAVSLDLETVRAVAHSHQARVTDVLLAVMVTTLHRLRPEWAEPLHGRLRVAVPLMVREPSSAAEGNLTAAVLTDVPFTAASPGALLADIRTRGARLHSGTRALASHFVMSTGLRVLPEPTVGWFARSVYGGRFFHAIVSNMAGPDRDLTFANVPIAQVFPILPSAPGVPLVAGVLSWRGVLGIGLSADPAVLDAAAFAAELPRVLAELDAAAAVADPGPAVRSGE